MKTAMKNGPAERLAVDAQTAEERQSQRSLVRKPRDQGEGDSETEDRTRAGEHKAFHEQLAHDAAAARPECATNSKLLGARGGASQKQVREVHASDE